MISEEELIKNYFEAKKLKEKYERQLENAYSDAKIPNAHYIDDLEDRSMINGAIFQISRLNEEINKMENYANDAGIALIEVVEKTR